MACFNTIPFYWPFETSVPFRVCFSAAKSSGKNKDGKTRSDIAALGGGKVMAVSKSMIWMAKELFVSLGVVSVMGVRDGENVFMTYF